MKILFLAMTLAFFASCNNSSNEDSDMSDTTSVNTGTEDLNSTTPAGGDVNTGITTDTSGMRGDTSSFEGAANDSIGK